MLVVFANSVSTGGCGGATSDVGPFYCPADQKLYIDPSFYSVMEKRLRAPGDFAQAYVIAHEVGHHVQNLIGSSRLQVERRDQEPDSVRVELQADCLAGVWGHTARASLEITDEDLAEALTAAHAIGDDTLGHSDERKYTHGSSAQRKRWFRRGFDSGEPASATRSPFRTIRGSEPLQVARGAARHGSSRTRMLRNSTGDPSASRQRKPVRGSAPRPPETSSPFTQRRISPLMPRT